MIQFPFAFAHCEHCHAFWKDVGGEYVVHRCSKQGGKEVPCPTRLALKPAAYVPEPGETIRRVEERR